MFSRWIGVSAVVLLVMGGSSVAAQSSADAFFYEAAQQYVAGNVTAARETVDQGLEVAPSDPRLLALRKKLRQKEGRGGGRSSRRGQGGQQQDQRSEGRNTQDDRRGTSSRDAQSRAEGKTASNRSDRRADRDPSSSGRPRGKPTRRRKKQNRGGRQRDNVLGRAQAVRLLRALENQEEKLLRDLQVRSVKEKSVEKDW